MELHHPALTALVDELYAEFGARLLSFKSDAAGIDVVAKRVAAASDRTPVRIWPGVSASEAREIEAQRVLNFAMPGGDCA